MNKKRFLIVSVLLMLLFSFSVYIVFWQPEDVPDTGKQEADIQRERSTELSKQEDEKSEDIPKGQSNISFEEYKPLYKSMTPDMPLPFQPHDCLKKKRDKELKYALLEFIFMEKTDKGKLVPFDTTRMEYVDIALFKKFKNRSASCDAAPIRPIPVDTASRIKVNVVKNCECLSYGLVPGKVYKFSEIENLGRVEHKFQVPYEDKMNYISPKSNKQPDLYRFPILVNDIKQKKPEKQGEKRPKRKTLTVTNIFPDEVSDQKLNNIADDIDLVYHSSGGVVTKELNSKNEQYDFQVPTGDDRKITGGDLMLHMKKKSVSENKSAQVRFYLLQYKANVSDHIVDLSDGPDYSYSPDRNVKRTISLGIYNDKLRKKHNIEIDVQRSDRVIWLKKDYGGMKPVEIYATKPVKLNGRLAVHIDAQPGTYQLYYGNKIIEKNFKWPPDE